jgi:hypothetical protein
MREAGQAMEIPIKTLVHQQTGLLVFEIDYGDGYVEYMAEGKFGEIGPCPEPKLWAALEAYGFPLETLTYDADGLQIYRITYRNGKVLYRATGILGEFGPSLPDDFNKELSRRRQLHAAREAELAALPTTPPSPVEESTRYDI